MAQKIMLNLDDETFQYLEVLAVGLNFEQHDSKDNEAFQKGHNKEKDHFGPLVSRMLEGIAESLASGVRRSGSWERNCIESLTGWDGTINRGMFGPLVCIPEDKTTVLED